MPDQRTYSITKKEKYQHYAVKMSDNIIGINEILNLVCDNIEKSELERNNKLLKSWRYILESIKSNAVNGKNLGANLYSHSRVIDLKNEILLVEADHPGWIQTLRLYQKYILAGLKRGVPELKISSLAFRLRGSKTELHNQISEEKIKEDLQNRLQKEEEILHNFDKKFDVSEEINEKKQMPENLQKILNRLKDDLMNS